MKLIDALQNVDKSQPQGGDWSEFCEALNIVDYDGWNEMFSERVVGYFLIKWLCTDTWVGVKAYFLDGELVAMSQQQCRKGDTEYSFVSHDAANKLIDLINSLMPDSELSYELLDTTDPVVPHYTVQFSNQLLTKKGFVDGKPCDVIYEFRENYLSQKVRVMFDDGATETVSISKFLIPIHLE